MTTILSKRASQPQFDLIKKLLAEKQLDESMSQRITVAREAAVKGHLSMTRATALISDLITLPRKASTDTSADEPKAGIYWIHGDHLVRVYLGQQSGKMLVKRINVEVDGDFTSVSYEYLGAASRVMVPAATPQRVPLKEVQEMSVRWGIATDHCMICGKRIDVPESVDRGIGPVCAARY